MRFKLFWNNLHKVLQVGLCLLFFGSAPLLIVIALDALSIIDAGNGLVFGLLTLLTFYPSLVLIAVGGVLTLLMRRKKSQVKFSFRVVYLLKNDVRLGYKLAVISTISSYVSNYRRRNKTIFWA